MSGGVSESSEVDSMQTMRSTRRLRPMYRRRDPAARSSFRSSNYTAIRRRIWASYKYGARRWGA